MGKFLKAVTLLFKSRTHTLAACVEQTILHKLHHLFTFLLVYLFGFMFSPIHSMFLFLHAVCIHYSRTYFQLSKPSSLQASCKKKVQEAAVCITVSQQCGLIHNNQNANCVNEMIKKYSQNVHGIFEIHKDEDEEAVESKCKR